MKWGSFIGKDDVVNIVGIFLLGHPAERAITAATKKRHAKAVAFLRRVETLQKVRSIEVAALAIAQAELLL
jgi:hypothetical protein